MEGCTLKNFYSYQIQNDQVVYMSFILICLIFDKPCQIARLLPYNKICGFREGNALQIINSSKSKKIWETVLYSLTTTITLTGF